MGTAASSFAESRPNWRRRRPADGEGAGAPRQAAPPDPGHDRRQLRRSMPGSCCSTRRPARSRHDRPGLCRCGLTAVAIFASCFRSSASTSASRITIWSRRRSTVCMLIALAFTCRAGSRRACSSAPCSSCSASVRCARRRGRPWSIWTAMTIGLARAVPADRQADRDAARQLPRTLCHHAGVRPDHRALHVPRDLLQLDETIALPERA